MTKWVALIRGVGPVSHKKMSMSDLRNGAADAGLAETQTLLATGNLLFRSSEDASHLATKISEIIWKFDLDLPVILRRAADLLAIRDANPFKDAATERPSKLLVLFLDRPAGDLPPSPDRERLAKHGREVYIDHPDGVGTSKLAPGRLDRQLGATGTTRNWNTLLKLIEATA